MKILVIIPAFNEAENIQRVIESIKSINMDLDYIVINDCSKDGTEQILIDNNACYITLPVNLGIGGGVQTGYIYAKQNGYDIAVQFDGDGQHCTEYIHDLIQPIINGDADVVIGSRFTEKTGSGFQSTFSRRLGINFLSALIKLCSGEKVRDVTSGFRAVNREMIEMFSEEYAQDYPEPEAIVQSACGGGRIREIPVEMKMREGGKSSITFFKSIYYMIKVSLALVLRRMTTKMKGGIK